MKQTVDWGHLLPKMQHGRMLDKAALTRGFQTFKKELEQALAYRKQQHSWHYSVPRFEWVPGSLSVIINHKRIKSIKDTGSAMLSTPLGELLFREAAEENFKVENFSVSLSFLYRFEGSSDYSKFSRPLSKEELSELREEIDKHQVYTASFGDTTRFKVPPPLVVKLLKGVAEESSKDIIKLIDSKAQKTAFLEQDFSDLEVRVLAWMETGDNLLKELHKP